MAGIASRAYRALPRPGDVKFSLLRADHDGWLLLDGRQTLSRATYARLYAEIGTAYGAGDGSGTFGLPQACDRVLMAAGPARPLGSTGGAESHALTADELPEHDHGYLRPAKAASNLKLSAGLLPLTLVGDLTDTPTTTAKAGKGKPFGLMPPYLALNAFVYAGL